MRPYRIAVFLAVIILACVVFAQPIQPIFMFFTDLMDTPADYTDDASKLLAVNAGETAVEFISSSTITLSEEEVEDYVGGMVTGGTETHIGVTYTDGGVGAGVLNFVVDPDSVAGSISAGAYNDNSVGVADMIHEDHGDVTYASGSAALDTDTVAVAEFLGSQDWGDMSTAADGTVSLDANTVAASEILSGDYGDIVIDGAGVMTLDVNVVAASELLSGDYGDISIDGAGAITIDADSVALTTDTTGNYAAGDAEAGNATSGDAAENFFGTADVVTDQTVCTDIEGTGLSIGGATLNWSAASTDLTDTADLLYEAELDDFSELQAQISDKTLVNEEDAVAWDALGTFGLGVTITTGDPLTFGTNRIDNGSDLLDGEMIANDTIDDDSIDFGDVNMDDMTDGATNAAVTLTQETNWDTAFGWGDHSGGGYQAQGDVLDDLNTLGAVTGDNYFLVGTAAGVFAWETTTTARTSIGLGTGDSPQFTHLGLGNTAADADIGLYYTGEVLTDTDNSAKGGLVFVLQAAKTSAAMTSSAWGIYGTARIDSTNTQNWTDSLGLRGVEGDVITEIGSSGTITGAAAFMSDAWIYDAATVTNLYGLFVSTPTVVGSKAINEYGIYVEDQNTGATLNYAIYTGAGTIHFGDNVEIPDAGYIGSASDTDALQIEADGDLKTTQDLGIGVSPSYALDVYSTGIPLHIVKNTSETGSLHTAMLFERQTTGTATLGIGIGTKFISENDAGDPCNTGVFGAMLYPATDGAEIGMIVLAPSYHGQEPGARLDFRIAATGATSGQSAVTFECDTADFYKNYGIVRITSDIGTARTPRIEFIRQASTFGTDAYVDWRIEDSGGNLEFSTGENTATTLRVKFGLDGGVHMLSMKSGVDQAGAGAAAGELYFDTDDGNTVKMGV